MDLFTLDSCYLNGDGSFFLLVGAGLQRRMAGFLLQVVPENNFHREELASHAGRGGLDVSRLACDTTMKIMSLGAPYSFTSYEYVCFSSQL
jgi:hypothetical protein